MEKRTSSILKIQLHRYHNKEFKESFFIFETFLADTIIGKKDFFLSLMNRHPRKLIDTIFRNVRLQPSSVANYNDTILPMTKYKIQI